MILVAGGGVAGAVAAAVLARGGADVTLVERERGPHHKICGEFLSGEAHATLRGLGVDPASLGAAPIGAVRLIHRSRTARVALPFPGFGLTRRALDEALLARAAAAGASLLRGHAIRRVDGTALDVEGHGTLRADTLFLATGKHDARGAPRELARTPEDLIGFKMYFSLCPAQTEALRGHVEVVLFDGGYAGLQLVEGDAANLCLLARRARFDAAGASWAGLLESLQAETPHLAARLAGARALLERPLTIARVPYGHVHRPRRTDPPCVFRVGDQAGVIPSFSGDGVSIALHSAKAGAAVWLQGGRAEAHHRALGRDLSKQIGLAWALYRMGRAWPGLMVAGAHAWPGALRMGARLTRVRPSMRGHEPRDALDQRRGLVHADRMAAVLEDT